MKTLTLLTLLISLLNGALNAQIKFQKTYGALGYEAAYDVQITSDGGYIIAGETSSFKDAAGDVYLIKTNQFGDTAWTKTYGIIGDYDYAMAIRQTSDGGYILCGNNAYNLLVIKTGPTGDTLWTKKYGVAANSAGFDIQQTYDGGYIILGFTYLSDYDSYLIKTDSVGNITWTKTYGGYVTSSAQLKGNLLQQTSDSGYVFISQPGAIIVGSWDYTIVKTNSLGDTLWSKIYGGTNQDIAYSIKTTNDGGYIVAGQTKSFGAGLWDAYLIKLDANGVLLWSKTYGGTGDDAATDIIQTNDGGYIFSGWTNSFGLAIYEGFVVKMNSMGVFDWTFAYGSVSALHTIDFWSVKQTADQGFIFAGDMDDGTGNVDAYLVKTDSLGMSGCYQYFSGPLEASASTIALNSPVQISLANLSSNAVFEMASGGITNTFCFTNEINEDQKINSLFSIYPNPFSETATLEFGQRLKNPSVTIQNSIGQKVQSIINVFEDKIIIHRANLPNGIYAISIMDGAKIIGSSKIVLTD